jgi:hypothetical protein
MTLMAAGPGRTRAADDPPAVQVVSEGTTTMTPEQLRGVIPYLSNPGVRNELALRLGLREVAGKAIYRKPASRARTEDVTAERVDPASDFDRMITGDPTSIAGQQSNASIAVNPRDQSIVAAIAENTASKNGNATDCSLYVSTGGGESYTYVRDMALPVTAPRTDAHRRR